ncbi:MAG: ATP-grasp domain-containing protein [Planctomycetota bacterium]
MSRVKPVVAVTGLEGRDNPYPGVAFASALRAARGDAIVLVGLAYEPTLTGCFRGDLFDRVYLTPLPGGPSATLLRRLREIHEEMPIDVLVPALDSELAVFAAHREELAGWGIRMTIPSAESVRVRYKQRLARWAGRNGIFTPKTEVITDPERFFRREEWRFPCFLKGPLADAVGVECVEEAIAACGRLASRWGFPVLAQEALLGEEYDVCSVAMPSGAEAATIAIKKTIQNSAGKAIGAEVVDDPDVLAAGRIVLEALAWEGPCEIEFLREFSSKRLFLLEVNARFPAWIGVAPAVGVNLPDLNLRIALQEPLPQAVRPRVGCRFLRSSRTSLSRAEDLGDLLSLGRLTHEKD